MATQIIYFYNFSGAVTKDISMSWNGDVNNMVINVPPNNITTPWVLIFNNGAPYQITYDLAGSNSLFNIYYDNDNKAPVYILNDPTIVLTAGPSNNYYSNGYRTDSAYIINGPQYQIASTYTFPDIYLAFSVPAVPQSVMNNLTLVPNAFAPVPPPQSNSLPTLTPAQKQQSKTKQDANSASTSTN